MRLIDADALLEELKVCDFVVSSIIGDGGTLLFEDDVIKRIKGMPTAERVGKWIRHPEVKNIYGGVCIECSECREKYVVQYVEDEKFCRNCGARMAEGEEG